MTSCLATAFWRWIINERWRTIGSRLKDHISVVHDDHCIHRYRLFDGASFSQSNISRAWLPPLLNYLLKVRKICIAANQNVSNRCWISSMAMWTKPPGPAAFPGQPCIANWKDSDRKTISASLILDTYHLPSRILPVSIISPMRITVSTLRFLIREYTPNQLHLLII